MKNLYSGPTGVGFGICSVFQNGQILLLLASNQLGRLSAEWRWETRQQRRYEDWLLFPRDRIEEFVQIAEVH